MVVCELGDQGMHQGNSLSIPYEEAVQSIIPKSVLARGFYIWLFFLSLLHMRSSQSSMSEYVKLTMQFIKKT